MPEIRRENITDIHCSYFKIKLIPAWSIVESFGFNDSIGKDKSDLLSNTMPRVATD